MDSFTSIYAYCNYLIHYKECGSYSMYGTKKYAYMYVYVHVAVNFLYFS